MTGRNSRPDNDGPASHPASLAQFGDKLASHNEEEFSAAVEEACGVEACGVDACEEPDH